jgi:hypothetical protein
MHLLNCHLWSVWLYHIFPHYLISSTIFEGGGNWNVCFDFLYNVCLKLFSLLQELSRVWSKMYFGLSVIPVVYFWNLNFLDRFLKILKYKISWKSVQWEPSCSVWMDRKTAITKLIVTFHNYVYTPKNC